MKKEEEDFRISGLPPSPSTLQPLRGEVNKERSRSQKPETRGEKWKISKSAKKEDNQN